MNEKQSKLKPVKKNKNELSAVKLKLLVTVVNRNKGELLGGIRQNFLPIISNLRE